MSAMHMDLLFHLWAATLWNHGDTLPFSNHHHLYDTVDKMPLSNIKWQDFIVEYTGDIPDVPNLPRWMKQYYKVWYHDPCKVIHQLLGNPDFAKEINLQPFHEYMYNGK